MLSFFQFGDWSLSVTAALALVARVCYIMLKTAAVGFGGEMKQWKMHRSDTRQREPLWETVGRILGCNAATDDKRVRLGPAAKSTKAHAGWYATCDCPALWE